MKVDYKEEEKKLTSNDYLVYYDTILDNPYIHYTPYPQQALAIMGHSRRKCIGGNAFSGKSLLGYILACQWVGFPDYRCLILRRTYDDVCAPGGIVDYIRKHCVDEYHDDEGNVVLPEEMRAKPNETRHKFTFPSGAEIWYNSSQREEDRERFRSRSFDNIIVDEASELPYQNLKYLTRSNRSIKGNKSVIPLHMHFISNPSLQSGTDFLKEFFVNDDAPEPYYEIMLKDNIYAPKDYAEQLMDLDEIDRAFQLEGRWDYVPDQGLLFSKQNFYDATVNRNDLRMDLIDYGVIGVDTATTGDDTTVATYIAHFSTGWSCMIDSVEVDDPFPEDIIIDFIDRIATTHPLDLVIIEKGAGADADFSERYWLTELAESMNVMGYTLDFRRPVSSKYARARPCGRAIKMGLMRICKEIPTYHRLLEEYMYITPDKKVLDQYPSPDAVDSVSIAFNLSNIMNGGLTITGYNQNTEFKDKKSKARQKRRYERYHTKYGTSYGGDEE